MQLTELKYKKLRKELFAIKDALVHSMELQSSAANNGDLKENEEYHTARAESERLSREKNRIEDILRDAEVISVDNSPRITLGSVIEVTSLDKNNKVIGEARCFTLENEGDTIIQKILGINSSLGKAIYNGTSGVYTVPENGGLNYLVKKIFDYE